MTTAIGTRSDQEIQQDVLAELDWDARMQPNEIGVVVQDGVVTLTGWVDSYARKWAAERTAHRIRGVRAVADDIEVRLPGTHEHTDSDLALAASRALEWDAFVPADDLDVTVSNGWLMLRGEVERGDQRRAAERGVRQLSGVRGVTNLITVQPPVRRSPEEVRRDIRNALVRSLDGGSSGVDVTVDGDSVTLTGTVRSLLDRQEAERAAWATPGVAEVSDQLVVVFD